MYKSLKVEDGVENIFFTSWTHICGHLFLNATKPTTTKTTKTKTSTKDNQQNTHKIKSVFSKI